jgi:hypothetical protein
VAADPNQAHNTVVRSRRRTILFGVDTVRDDRNRRIEARGVIGEQSVDRDYVIAETKQTVSLAWKFQ